MVQLRDDVVGLDAAILVAARDLGGVGPPGQLHRPAGRLQGLQASGSGSTSSTTRTSARTAAPRTPSPRPAQFNLMFKTHAGPVEDDGRRGLPAPRDGAGHVRRTSPTCCRRAARSRRSASPRSASRSATRSRRGNFVFRTREFEQMEMEFFVPPDEARQWYEYWCSERYALVPRPRHPGRAAAAAAPRRRRAVPLLGRHLRRRVPLPVGLGRARGHRQPRRLRPHPARASTRARSSTTSTRRPTSATRPT